MCLVLMGVANWVQQSEFIVKAAASIVTPAPCCAQGVRVKAFAVAADGCTAVAVLFDSSVTVWDLATGCPRAVLQASLGAALSTFLLLKMLCLQRTCSLNARWCGNVVSHLVVKF
jgi:hypothetical protein